MWLLKLEYWIYLNTMNEFVIYYNSEWYSVHEWARSHCRYKRCCLFLLKRSNPCCAGCEVCRPQVTCVSIVKCLIIICLRQLLMLKHFLLLTCSIRNTTEVKKFLWSIVTLDVCLGLDLEMIHLWPVTARWQTATSQLTALSSPPSHTSMPSSSTPETWTRESSRWQPVQSSASPC